MCSVFTVRWGQIVWEVGRARPPIPVGVHELAVVLPLPNRVSYTVKWLCRRWGWHILLNIDISEGFNKSDFRRGVDSTVPLSPFPMKILYRRELHKTTPTNFLYHVRLTYWLPLQLLWAELYLNLKGTQMGSPPVGHGELPSYSSCPIIEYS